MSFFAKPETWVLISFLLFFALLFYYRVPVMILKALDERAERIRRELEEARQLHEEARKLLAEVEAKREQAEAEAKEIVQVARAEAEAVTHEMRKQFDELMARKQAAAEQRIRLAQDTAVREIRAHVGERALQVAEAVLREELKGRSASALVDEAIKEAAEKLH